MFELVQYQSVITVLHTHVLYSTGSMFLHVQCNSIKSSVCKMSRRSFSLEDKLTTIISLLESGTKNVYLARRYKTGSSTISTIYKHREKWFKLQSSRKCTTKKVREAVHKPLDDALLPWFKQQCALNISVNGPILGGKANDLAKMMKLDGFSCSMSWIQRFRTRHDIAFGKTSGESNSVDSTVCDDWLHNVWPIIRAEYTDDNIFNADEAGIFYLTPDSTLRFKSKSCAGGKLSKERITNCSRSREYVWDSEETTLGNW